MPHPTLGYCDDKKNRVVRIMEGKTAKQIVEVLNNKAKIGKMTLVTYHLRTLVAKCRSKATRIIR